MRRPLEIWGGIECTLNRVGERWFSQLARSGHVQRIGDLDTIAALGIRSLRYPALWEMTAPHSPDQLDFTWTDARLERLRALGIRPILGLLHHGSGPAYTSLVHEEFASTFARYAGQVAARYPWVLSYTPINEPLTTARFAGLYGLWHPHGRDDRVFVRALLNQCRATVLAMRAIRNVNSDAQLLQTDDLGKTYSSAGLRYQADFDNERRWLGWDLLLGRVTRQHPLRVFLLASGSTATELDWFEENPCPPALIGINHYVTSDRYLDEHYSRYPLNHHGGNGRHRYADVEAVRVVSERVGSWRELLRDTWARYRSPLALTEVHLGCTEEHEQLRWFYEAWTDANQACADGIDIRAVTPWALLGSFNWDTLVTKDGNHYEPGAFDIRSGMPVRTQLAHLLQGLITGAAVWHAHPEAQRAGWWRRPERLSYATA